MQRAATKPSERTAILMLLVACALWGMSFHWNKTGQEIVGKRLAEASGDARLLAEGPAVFIAMRFALGVILWACIFPSAIRGWSMGTVWAGLLTGALLSVGMLAQHYGLWHTSESLSAFLTSLTVLFTPLIVSLVLRQKVPRILWISIALATIGTLLMTIFRDEGRFDRGAILGLLCALVFSGHILLVEHFGRRENTVRFTLVQFIVATLIFSFYSLLRPGGSKLLSVNLFADVLANRELIWLVAVSTVFATIFAYGIMMRYQPRTTATRAALTYMTEPLFATAYAWLVAGREVTGMALVGGGLVIASNIVAEVFGRKPSSGNGESAREPMKGRDASLRSA